MQNIFKTEDQVKDQVKEYELYIALLPIDFCNKDFAENLANTKYESVIEFNRKISNARGFSRFEGDYYNVKAFCESLNNDYVNLVDNWITPIFIAK